MLRMPGGISRIEVGSGLLDRAGSLIGADRATVIADAGAAGAGLLERLEGSLVRAGCDRVHAVTIPGGERRKSWNTAGLLLRRLARAGHERNDPIVALGGGVIGDLAGFVAATYMRGVPLVQIPTTLLAQVDSSVGGKTGVNLPEGKNLAGAFHPARLVIADPEALRSLPAAHYRGGLAEIVKCAVIADPRLFRLLEDRAAEIRLRDAYVLERIIRAALAVKVSIVNRDPHERGTKRALLNYGHTVGHALEAASEYRGHHHGDAVSVGMEAESFLAERLGLADRSLRDRQGGLLEAFGLPRSATLAAAGVLPRLANDKKVQGGRVRFALPTGIGRATFPVTPAPSRIREALRHVARG